MENNNEEKNSSKNSVISEKSYNNTKIEEHFKDENVDTKIISKNSEIEIKSPLPPEVEEVEVRVEKVEEKPTMKSKMSILKRMQISIKSHISSV